MQGMHSNHLVAAAPTKHTNRPTCKQQTLSTRTNNKQRRGTGYSTLSSTANCSYQIHNTSSSTIGKTGIHSKPTAKNSSYRPQLLNQILQLEAPTTLTETISTTTPTIPQTNPNEDSFNDSFIKGPFSVSAFVPKLWKIRISLKIRIFMWLLWKRGLVTRAVVSRWNQ